MAVNVIDSINDLIIIICSLYYYIVMNICKRTCYGNYNVLLITDNIK